MLNKHILLKSNKKMSINNKMDVFILLNVYIC